MAAFFICLLTPNRSENARITCDIRHVGGNFYFAFLYAHIHDSEMLGYALEHVREQKGLTQFVVANHCEVAQTTVSRWEKMGVLPPEDVKRVADSLGTSVLGLKLAAAVSRADEQVTDDALLTWPEAIVLDSEVSAPTSVVLVGISLRFFREAGQIFKLIFKRRDG